ncbi:HDIG domain-containing protein [Patescibacteria group bacterium]|nr:HDIG domain-containing protein [Patescibacteria group bacterium]
MKKGLNMPRRVNRRKSEPTERGIKKIFAKSYFSQWLWGMGMAGGLFLVFLFPFSASLTVKLGTVILIVLSALIFLIYLFRFYPKLLTVNFLPLFLVLILSTSLMGKIVLFLPQISNYFVPIAFLSILFSLFFNPTSAVLVTAFLSIVFAVNAKSLEILPVLFFGGVVGIYGASFIHQRADITKVGVWIGFTNLITILGMGLVAKFSLAQILISGLWGLGSGIFSSILVTVSLPYLETYFGITTDIKLLELTDLNHPLLKRLSIEAPGTHHHAMMVATLAVAGAENIGANALLARVGAYYHDIGKVTRPHFFFENSGLEDLTDKSHQKVNPNLSSTIILSHVKDGTELAKIHRLPKVVIDIISEHHGKSLIAYFYRKALEEKKNEEQVDETSFRYPSHRPQSKESAIVMLADSLEADFRFSSGRVSKGSSLTRHKISSRIEKVMDNKLKDHQLDECNLTLRELTKIKEAFARVFAGLAHTRGRYPEEVLKNR